MILRQNFCNLAFETRSVRNGLRTKDFLLIQEQNLVHKGKAERKFMYCAAFFNFLWVTTLRICSNKGVLEMKLYFLWRDQRLFLCLLDWCVVMPPGSYFQGTQCTDRQRIPRLEHLWFFCLKSSTENKKEHVSRKKDGLVRRRTPQQLL